MIDLTVVINNDEALRKFTELKKVAKDSTSAMVTDFDTAEMAIDLFTKKINENKAAIEDQKQSIKVNQKVIKELSAEYQKVQEALSNAPTNKSKEVLSAQLKQVGEDLAAERTNLAQNKAVLQAYNDELDKSKTALQKSKAELKAYERTQNSIRTQLMSVRNEMQQLELSGQKSSARYKELQGELQRLGVAYRKVAFEQKALTTGATQWAGLQSALQGVLGVFATGQGVIGLFTDKSEELVKIQTRLQSIMAIIMGMSQVSNTLHATSAFRMTTWAKATELVNSAYKTLATGLIRVGVSANAARIATAAFMATATLGLSVAIGAVVSWVNKLIDKHKSAKQAAEESAAKQREAFESYASSVVSNASETITKFKSIQQAYNALGDDMQAKAKFIKENKKAFDELGVSITGAKDADNLFIDNAEAFITSIELRARAMAGMNIASAKYEEALKEAIRKESISNVAEVKTNTNWRGKKMTQWSVEGFDTSQNEELNRRIKLASKTEEKRIKAEGGANYSELLRRINEAEHNAATEYIQEIKKEIDDSIKDIEDQASKAIDLSAQQSTAAESTFKKGGFTTTNEAKAAEEARRQAERERDAQTRASESLIELLTRLRNDAQQADIDAMAEGTDKKIAQINYDYDRREEAIKKREEELERLAAQADTEVSEQDRGYLSALRTDNELTRSNALSQIEIDEIEAEDRAMDEYLAKYGDYQEKRFAITKQYAEKIAKAQTEGERLLYGKQQEEALRDLDLSMVETSNLWTRLFKDAGTMATSSINGVIEDVERLLKYIDQVQSGGDADMSIIAALGLTKEQVDTLMADPKKIEAILDALKQKRDELNTRNPFGALIQGFKDLKKAAGDADAQMAAVNKIIAGAQGAAQLIGDVGDSMSELGEAIGSDFVSGFGSAMSEISDVANSAINGAMTGMAIGGPIGAAIGAGIGLASGIIKVISKRLQYNKQIREEYQNTLRKEYLAEYEINTLYRERYKWAKKIGEATLSYLNRNTKEAQSQYEANQREQEELWAKLMGSEYVSSERYKHGTWFRKAKIIKGYSTLAGQSWEDIELLAAQGKLTKEAQEYYEALKKAREEGEELEERMEQIAEETREAFTGIGFDSLVDGIVEGFKSGKRSMSDFADDFEGMMKNAVLQSLKMTALEEPLRKWYEDFAAAAGDDDGLTQQEIEELKASYAQIIENAGRQADELERITGVSLGSGTDAQTATARGFQAMSQETGSELNGRFTAIQGDVHDIKAFVIEHTNNDAMLLYETMNIRDIMIQLNGNVADIRTYTRVLPAMRETLAAINRKLDNI